MCLKEMAERNGLRALCEKVCDNRMFVTRVTNGLLRAGIRDVDDFMATDIEDCLRGMGTHAGGFYSVKTRETLIKMKEINR